MKSTFGVICVGLSLTAFAAAAPKAAELPSPVKYTKFVIERMQDEEAQSYILVPEGNLEPILYLSGRKVRTEGCEYNDYSDGGDVDFTWRCNTKRGRVTTTVQMESRDLDTYFMSYYRGFQAKDGWDTETEWTAKAVMVK